jgi:ABC-type enterobactin transport system permease subunit
VAGWLALLIVTNLLTVALLIVRGRRRRVAELGDDVAEVFTAPRPSGVTTRSRRLITIEVLNPIELVGTRGRVAGLAGSLAPGLARRLVYDQVLKTLRRELADKQVVADVRLHQLHPVRKPPPVSGIATTAEPAGGTAETATEVDEVSTVDLADVDTDQL